MAWSLALAWHGPLAGARAALGRGVKLDDAELAARTLNGDSDAYGELVRRHQKGVYNAAYRLVGNKQDALDLAQEAFLRAYKALATYDPARPFAPWIHTIVTNLALNLLRQRRPHASLEDDETLAADERAQPERALASRERQDALRRALLKLPPRQRAVIELRHFQDLSYDEIAQALGISVSDVKSELYRGRQRLREWVER